MEVSVEKRAYQVRNGADVNVVNYGFDPPKTAMDLAAGARRGDLLEMLRRRGGRAFVHVQGEGGDGEKGRRQGGKKGEDGAFEPGKGKGGGGEEGGGQGGKKGADGDFEWRVGGGGWWALRD